MLTGKPILAGDSDLNQLKIIFDLVGSPTDENMPGWKNLPGAEGQIYPQRPSTLSQRFREFVPFVFLTRPPKLTCPRYGSGAISLLNELLKLNWRKRINALDALNHPYFRNEPLPSKPGDLPTFEESHELDRRKFRGQKAAPPPAPKGGTVGMGPTGGWGGEPAGNGHLSYGDSYGNYRPHQNGSRYPSHGTHRNGGHLEDRRPAWRRDRDERPDTRLPPRPPPVDLSSYDGGRSDRLTHESYRSRSRDLDRDRAPPRSRGVGNVDTYIPSYGSDGPRRDDRARDDRRRRDERDDRRLDRDSRDRDRDRDRLDYDDRSRSGRTRSRSRSRSPARNRDRDRVRDREPMDRERDRDQDLYRR